jgi:hypothetical protein
VGKEHHVEVMLKIELIIQGSAQPYCDRRPPGASAGPGLVASDDLVSAWRRLSSPSSTRRPPGPLEQENAAETSYDGGAQPDRMLSSKAFCSFHRFIHEYRRC